MNLVAIACATVVFSLVLVGDALDPFFAKIVRGVFAHDLVAVAIGCSPIVAALLVGIARSGVSFRTRR